jgi:hypothetical protein
MAQTQSETRQVAADQTGKGATGSGPAEPKSNQADAKNPKNGASTASDTDPTELLKSDHRHVEQLFGSFEKATNADQKSQLAEQICTELMVHTLIEEEIFIQPARVIWSNGSSRKRRSNMTAPRR